MSRFFTVGLTALAILCFTPDASQARAPHPVAVQTR
jgi:hypothetical protein